MFRSVAVIHHTVTQVCEHLAQARGFGHLSSPAAVELVLGTFAAESEFTALRQVPTGPALGLAQMEPDTHDDIWSRFLAHRPELRARVTELLIPAIARVDNLKTNIVYMAAMARLHYARVPRPLPAAGDVPGQAAYWKAHYNTAAGKGTVDDYVSKHRRLVAPHLKSLQ